MAKMTDYGDRVQFSLTSGGPQPSYQIINQLDKKMAFDRNHHLLQPQADEFVGVNATPVFSIDQIKARIAGVSLTARAKTTAVRATRSASGTSRTAAAKLEDQFAAQRYDYFKNNRQTLPPTISEHTQEIAALMMQGKSAEEAFGEVVKKYF